MLRSFYIICALYINISKKNIIIFTPLRHHHHYLTTLETLRLESLVNNVNDCWSKMLKLGRAVHINKAATNTVHTQLPWPITRSLLFWPITQHLLLSFGSTGHQWLSRFWQSGCFDVSQPTSGQVQTLKKPSSKLWVSIHITAAIHLR